MNKLPPRTEEAEREPTAEPSASHKFNSYITGNKHQQYKNVLLAKKEI